MYEELVKELRDSAEWADRLAVLMGRAEGDAHAPVMRKAADAIEELQRICNAMKPKHDAVCVKCAYYAEAKYNDKGFLICPASGMDITAWDFCSYFEPLPQPPKEEEQDNG